ncbi:BON domain-containing protein [Cupriavidus sp. AcVe19-1a]|uniref:BON domain-containing protein n=1 Tax=Cupriavidus sp. AcVe19-1a TaxID=2821359 RepID=UPI001AE6F9FA|nr:BON domain-containing protein [Cupriavidus sp. AcVe19-1a]MBP0631650.1 BON domain-containing protein [Cupriavidus sp. AcVe19-1a]
MKDYPPSEIRGTWRHRGYDEPDDTRQARHWRSGDTGGSPYGYGEARYGMEDEDDERPTRPSRWAAQAGSRRMPRGYQRTDARIRDDLCERLAHADDDVSDVTVDVVSGIVTLAGTVRDRDAKFHIEQMAEDVLGVSEVRNNIQMARPGSSADSGGIGKIGERGGGAAHGEGQGQGQGEQRVGQSTGERRQVGSPAGDVLYIVQGWDGRFLANERGEGVMVKSIAQAGLFDDADVARAAAAEHCGRGYRLLATRR